MKTMIVGDLHSMPSNLEDTGIILDLCKQHAKIHNVEAIIFLGDIFHTHAVVRQEPAHFVKRKVLAMTDLKIPIFLMAGNHDGQSPHSVETNSVRLVFGGMEDEGIFVVDTPEGHLYKNFFMVPFIGDNNQFVASCQKNPDSILVCHQTVAGAYYENKQLAPGGVNQNLLPQKFVIAGHIHMNQQVSKVFYPGTPRALTANEYNDSKGLWIFDSENYSWLMVSTDDLVKRFIRYEVEEGKDWGDFNESSWKPKDDVRIWVSGSETFYRQFVEEYEHLADRVRFIPNIRKVLGKSIDVEANGENLYKGLGRYVFDIYEADDNLKGKIWRKLQDLIPNLGDRG